MVPIVSWKGAKDFFSQLAICLARFLGRAVPLLSDGFPNKIFGEA